MKVTKEINPQLSESEIHIRTYSQNTYERLVSKFDNRVKLETTQGMRILERSDIIYIEARRNYLEVHLAQETLSVRLPLYKMSDLLGGDFIQISRSYLINFQHLSGVESDVVNGMVARVSGFKIPISRRYLPNIYKRIEEDEK